MTNEEMTNRCEYCTQAVPLIEENTDDKGICLMYPNYLSAYGYDIHGSGSNGLIVKINYCPMCGRELKVKQMTNEMTVEEAVKILTYERDNDIFVSTEHRERIHQALTMAIQALEAQPTNAVILNVTNKGRWREEEEYSYGLKSKKIWWDDGIVAESEDAK